MTRSPTSSFVSSCGCTTLPRRTRPPTTAPLGNLRPPTVLPAAGVPGAISASMSSSCEPVSGLDDRHLVARLEQSLREVESDLAGAGDDEVHLARRRRLVRELLLVLE